MPSTQPTPPGPAPDTRDTAATIRATIQSFLQDRLKAALAKPGFEAKREELIARYRYATWLADAARRAAHIRQVTHADSFTHPAAGGSSLYAPGNEAAGPHLIGTHTLAGVIEVDVVGHAGAMDVYAFLSLTVAGKTLFGRATESDPALMRALSSDPAEASAWMEAFAAVGSPDPHPASHALTKQVFWPVGPGAYHLLAPLFSSALAHCVWTTINDDRWSPEAKLARAARKNQEWHPDEIHDYPDFVTQRFGGSKPQNISVLNTRRHGENFLLSSLPPAPRPWQARPPLRIESIFPVRFGTRPHVRVLVDELRDYLIRMSARNTIDIRNARAAFTRQIIDALAEFAVPFQRLAPGWTALPDCRLHPIEGYWLDPGRCSFDPSFALARDLADWEAGLSHRFANWLNAALENDDRNFHLNDRDHQVWADALAEHLQFLPTEVPVNE